MKNLKKIDDFDFVFINKSLSEKEDKEFSDFLNERRTKLKHKKILRPAKTDHDLTTNDLKDQKNGYISKS